MSPLPENANNELLLLMEAGRPLLELQRRFLLEAGLIEHFVGPRDARSHLAVVLTGHP